MQFAGAASRKDHFLRHGGDFGATSAAGYEMLAAVFLTGDKPIEALEKTRVNGDVVRFNPWTDEFGVASRTAIRTYYKTDPNVHGYRTNLDYFPRAVTCEGDV